MEGDLRTSAFHRVLLKLSGQALGSETRAIDPATTKEIARYVKNARSLGVDIAIVIGENVEVRRFARFQLGETGSEA